MRVAVTGSSGLIGSHLVPALRAEGHDVVRLVRRAPVADDEIGWDPTVGVIDTAALAGIDGAVNLAGAGLGDHRWTDAYKRTLVDSRIDTTTTLARAMAALAPKPRVLVSGSAIGFYGDTGDRAVDETSRQGHGFAADLVDRWEKATEAASAAGIRVVHARTGLVVASSGTWGRLTPLFRLGLGGRMGDGKQYWSFISIDDEVRALIRLLTDDTLDGPVDLTAPNPVTNREVTATMGTVLRRPTLFTVPSFALHAALGEFAGEVLNGQRVIPRKLLDAGFTFDHPTFEDAFRASL